MRITLIISSLNAGGAERVLSYLANYLVSKEYTVSIVTFAKKDTEPFYQIDSKINLIQLNYPVSGNKFFTKAVITIKRLIALRLSIKNTKPDVIISFIDIMNVMALIASWGLKIPVVVSERIDPHFNYIPIFLKYLRCITYFRAKKIIMQTGSAASYFNKFHQKLLQIIQNPVFKANKIKQQYATKITSLITIGRLDKQKNHSFLVKQIAKLLPLFPDLSLTIYGEGSERDNLEQLIKDLKLQKHVFLLGVDHNLTDKLSNADLFVFPSRYEGFPNALCEAMAIGLPVIASNCSGNIDIVQHNVNGLLFQSDDHVDFIANIKNLLNHPKKAAILGQNAREICNVFSPEKVFAMWDKVIIEVTDKNHQI